MSFGLEAEICTASGVYPVAWRKTRSFVIGMISVQVVELCPVSEVCPVFLRQNSVQYQGCRQNSDLCRCMSSVLEEELCPASREYVQCPGSRTLSLVRGMSSGLAKTLSCVECSWKFFRMSSFQVCFNAFRVFLLLSTVTAIQDDWNRTILDDTEVRYILQQERQRTILSEKSTCDNELCVPGKCIEVLSGATCLCPDGYVANGVKCVEHLGNSIENSLLAHVKIKVEIMSTGLLDNRGRRATGDQLGIGQWPRVSRPMGGQAFNKSLSFQPWILPKQVEYNGSSGR
ncbi:uncharacterized protein TNCV_4396351 [Trichonephila clavipes]|uniref:EGF-like domain-containing protein n=1 Tax=Trichonephila clavipes TaxID=2585209 RepID=A0A8X6W5C0_TRICX|nr:uncharacterized protein TNCV_4396351 [Trichonephila clavipes]